MQATPGKGTDRTLTDGDRRGGSQNGFYGNPEECFNSNAKAGRNPTCLTYLKIGQDDLDSLLVTFLERVPLAEVSLPLGGLVRQDVVQKSALAADLSARSFAKTLGRAPIRFHLRHVMVSPGLPYIRLCCSTFSQHEPAASAELYLIPHTRQR